MADLKSSIKPQPRPLFDGMNYDQYMEYIADEIKDNPIAQLGVDPNIMSVTPRPQGPLSEGFEDYLDKLGSPTMNAFYTYFDENEDYVEIGEDLKKAKPVQAHEFTHRGFRLLKNYYDEDPEFFVDKYGQAAANIVKDIGTREAHQRHEFDTEMYDNREAVFETPSGPMRYGEHTEGDAITVDKFQRYRSLLGPRVEKAQTNKLDRSLFDAFQQLERAAGDMMNKRKGYADGGLADQMNSMLPAADRDTRSTEEYLGKSDDEFNPLQFAKESWESAKERFMDAGITEVDANDPALYNAYLRSVDYLKDTGLAGLELIDAAARVAIGTLGEVVTGDDQTQKRFERDIYSMPDAFAGMIGTKSISQLDDAIESAVGTGIQAAEKAKDVGYAAYQKAPPVVGDIVGQTRAAFGGDKDFGITSDVGPRPLSAFGGARASFAPNIKSIDAQFEIEAQPELLDNLDIDFDNDPSGSMVRMMDELEKNPEKYPRTLEEIKKGNWFRGRDNLMRFEIDDFMSKATPQNMTIHSREELNNIFSGHDFDDSGFMSPYDPAYTDSQEKMYSTLEDVFEHQELFKQYPELKNMPVVIDTDMDEDTLGYFDPEKGLIAISRNIAKDAEATRSTLLHEVQHAIQRLEDFETGTGQFNLDTIEIKMAAKDSPTIKNIEADYEKELDNYLNSSIKIKTNFISGAGQKLSESIKEFELRLLAEESSTIFKKNNAISYEDLKKKYDSSSGAKQLVKDLASKDLPSTDKIFTYATNEIIAAEALAAGRAPHGFIVSPDETFKHMPKPISAGVSYLDLINKTSNVKKSSEFADNYLKQLETVLARVADRAVGKGKEELFKSVFKLDPEDVVGNFMHGSREFFVEKISGVELPLKPDDPILTRDSFNDSSVNRVIYRAKRGETEARNVQSRKDMPASKRSPENVFDTEDVVPEEQWGDPELKQVKAGEDIFARKKVFGLKGKPEPEVQPEPKSKPTPGFLAGVRKKIFGPFSESANFTPQDFGYYVDNPSEEWVKNKQKYAEKYAREGGKSAQKLLSGPQTAFLGTDNKKPLYLDTEFLSTLKGANDEVTDMSNPKYVDLKKSVEKEGFVPDQKGNTILIGVNHKGQAFIMEGNNRVAVAKEYGVPSIKAEVKYFNGAEDADSPFSPQNILKYASQKPRQFAEGGAVSNMNQQMSFAFADGGLRDDGMREDPVSGNEVPSGSMANEVRDDIPAQLSEGEYVVPADVVRYYGVKFFEDLRNEAKMGLQDMEARGRIGGEPVPEGGPMNDDDLTPEEMAAIQEMMGMYQGGSVTGFAQGGLQTDQDVLAAGQQAQQKQFTGFPLGATIFPRAESGKIETVPTTPAPTITIQETAESCAAKGMSYDPATQTCVAMPVQAPIQTGSSDDSSPPPPAEPAKPWYESVDWTTTDIADPTKFESIMSMTPLGQVVSMRNIAGQYAKANILEAAGNSTAAKQIRDNIDEYVNKQSLVSKIAKDAFGRYADGDWMTIQYLNSIGIETPKGLKTEDKGGMPAFIAALANDPTKRDLIAGSISPERKKLIKQSQVNEAEKAKVAAEKAAAAAAAAAENARSQQIAQMQQDRSDETKSTNFGQSVAKNLQGKTSAEKIQQVTSATKGLSKEEKKGGAKLDTKLGITGLNKGGLMAAKPKTETKRQYKKGGLAGKK